MIYSDKKRLITPAILLIIAELTPIFVYLMFDGQITYNYVISSVGLLFVLQHCFYADRKVGQILYIIGFALMLADSIIIYPYIFTKYGFDLSLVFTAIISLIQPACLLLIKFKRNGAITTTGTVLFLLSEILIILDYVREIVIITEYISYIPYSIIYALFESVLLFVAYLLIWYSLAYPNDDATATSQDKLILLNKMFQNGEITEEEFTAKQAEILNTFIK